MFKKDKPIIEFISTVPGLDGVEDLRPKPAKNYIPEWWKRLPAFTENNIATVKICPSFPNYFDLGFIIPMWSDTAIRYNKETSEWGYHIANGSVPQWDHHMNDQFLNHIDADFTGKEVNYVFKAVCPWKIITRPGWSVLQLPLFYHFNKKWTIMPGVVDTDIHHEVNQQVLYFGDSDGEIINAGEPFVLYVPFERKKIKYDIREPNKKDLRKISISDANVFGGFRGSARYRKAQNRRDKKN